MRCESYREYARAEAKVPDSVGAEEPLRLLGQIA
ncbi:Uncharacterised protein [Mycobacterium xenopi]|uniref:Uncharacterized protein n=2 Tax=Mycobacterium xenopi TaxID=1789 RepID=A0AAD1M1X7_MYCXE|nr:hypothetical protein MYXE_33490 [Mycobacterium xenopi]SPX89196.1 Uncharacterised protein [Mycobacterium xenopi]